MDHDYYSVITGDYDDYTLDNLEDQLGRAVEASDLQQIIDNLLEQYDRYVYVAVHGPDVTHMRRSGKDRMVQAEYARMAASSSARIHYYQNLLSRWPV